MPEQTEAALCIDVQKLFNPGNLATTAVKVWKAGTTTIVQATYSDASKVNMKFSVGCAEVGGDTNIGSGTVIW